MIRFSRMNVHNKLAVALVGAALLAFSVASTVLLFYESFTQEQRARQAMEPYARLVTVGAETAVAFKDAVRAQEILDTLRANPQILEAAIVLPDGGALAGYSLLPKTSLHPHLSDGIYLFGNNAELVLTLQDGAHFHLVMSLDEFNRQTRSILLLFAAGVVVLLVLVTVGLMVALQRSLVRPVANLAASIEQVNTQADYNQHVPAEGADEVARLGRSFNAMMAVIRERDNELRSLTAFQRTILDSVAYGIISATPDGVVTTFNPAAERLLGYTADEVVGKQTPECWHDAAEIARYAEQLSAELGEPIAPGFGVFTARPSRNLPEEREWTFIRKDGTHLTVQLSVSALHDKEGRITGFVGLTYDLTERRRDQRQLQLLAYALDKVKETILLMGENDPDFFYVNQSAANTLGYSREEMMGGLCVYDIAPDWNPEVWAQFWPELCRRRQMQFEARLQTRDGRIFPSEVTGNYFEFDGKIYNLAICRDISERKEVEKVLTNYAAIVESTDDAIVGKTLEGIITSWNRGAERMFGYRADEVVGQSIVFLIPADRRSEEQEILQKIRRGESVVHYETVRQCKDGRLIDVSVTVSPLKNLQGEIVGASKIARDITERKKAEEELRRHREHLEELVSERTAQLEIANKELEAFSYSVSHDLRTPLRAIDGFSRLLATKYASKLDDEAQRLIHVVRDNSARMSQLIDDILAFSRIGRGEMHMVPVDMRQLVEAVWLDLEPLRANRNISFDLQVLPPAQGDAALLRQVWTNLLSNALKFTGHKASAHIEIGGGAEGDGNTYYIKDDGAGFDQNYAHKLFGVFQRLHALDEFEGTGIGLAIVKRIVTRHGGAVSGEGRVGEGAVFRFTLPKSEV